MVVCQLSVDAKFCGPVSVGTVSLIKLVQETLCVSLSEAKGMVDRAVFGAETVTITFPDSETAQQFAAAARRLECADRLRLEFGSNGV